MTFTNQGIQELVRDGGAELIAKALNESDDAKQLLRAAGYGVTGQGLKETVQEVLEELSDWKEQ